MKRCPSCEFIYEEDQSVCDMDGQALVHDHALSIPSRNTALTQSAAPKTSSLGSVALPASVGLLLAALFSVGFYASSEVVQPGDEKTIVEAQGQGLDINTPLLDSLKSSPAEVAASVLESASSPADQPGKTEVPPVKTDAIQERAHRKEDAQRLSVSRGLPPLPRVQPLPRLPAARPMEAKSGAIVTIKPADTKRRTESNPPPKKDSKVESFFKKTGRLLSKPFKL